jgi:hypothetical protein
VKARISHSMHHGPEGLSANALRVAEPEPLSVVQALMDAEIDTDLELAVSLFAGDADVAVAGGSRAMNRPDSFARGDH